jgi:hypothetical protein
MVMLFISVCTGNIVQQKELQYWPDAEPAFMNCNREYIFTTAADFDKVHLMRWSGDEVGCVGRTELGLQEHEVILQAIPTDDGNTIHVFGANNETERVFLIAYDVSVLPNIGDLLQTFSTKHPTSVQVIY